MKVKIGNRYMTEGGHEVRIYAVDGRYDTIHGAYLTPEGWEACEWYKGGYAPYFSDDGSSLNLVEVKDV